MPEEVSLSTGARPRWSLGENSFRRLSFVAKDVEEIVDHENAQERLKNVLRQVVDRSGFAILAVVVAVLVVVAAARKQRS